MTALPVAKATVPVHIGQLPARRQVVFYFQFIYRFLFAWLVTLYAAHFGVAGGWLSFEWAITMITVYAFATMACMLVARQRRFARTAQKVQLTFDLGVLAFGLPLDPNPGLPLMFVFYLVFLDLGVRYGFQLYLRQCYAALVAIGIMIYLRAFQTDIGFTPLDAWQVLLFLAVLVYGLQVFALRDRATQNLRETQERLQLAMESPGICAWYTDSPLEILKPEENFHRLVGLSPEQFSGRMADYIAMIHPEDREAEVQRWTAFIQDGATDYESKYRLVRTDGEVLTISSRAHAKRDRNGRALSVSGMIPDLTGQKRQEEAMLRMEERYRLATQSAQVGVWTWDIVADVFENDATVSRYLGRPPGATARLADVLATIHPEDRSGVAQRFRALTDSTQDEFFDEHRVVLPGGEVRVVHVRGTIFRDANGRAVRMAGANVDATSLAQARRALEDKTRALERSNRELDDFSYIASHDLKEPLRGIGNYAQFLEEDYATKLDDKGQGMLRKMREQTRRMETLIQELLDVARLSRAQLNLAETDLQATLDEILASLEFSIAEQHVQVRVPRPLPHMRCDRVRVGELFRNLITNAIKYNDKPERWIEVGYTGTAPAVFFFVRDNGVGIRPEHHDRVFTLFQRLHTREAFGGGSGVGLTIAKKIAEMHEGRIWLQSEAGAGTTFYFTLGKGAAG